MDESGSVGSYSFEKMKSFVAGLAQQFVISRNRFSVITFNNGAYRRFGLNTHHDSSSIWIAINNIGYRSGGTNIASALQEAHEEFQRNQRNVPKVVLLITDGWSDGGEIQKAQMLKDYGVIIFSIGVGYGVNENLLNGISTSHYYTTIVQSFDLLINIQSQTSNNICKQSK